MIACCASVGAMAQTVPHCAPAPNVPLQNQLATLQVGDYWIYTLTGTSTPPAGAPAPPGAPPGAPTGPEPLGGTFVEHVEMRTLAGRQVLALVTQENLTIGGVGGPSLYGNNPTPTGIFYIQQDPTTHDVQVIGDNAGPNGTDEVAATPQEFYPGQWSSTAAYDNTLDFGANGKTDIYLNVSGTAAVSTSIGDFQAWVAPNGASSTGGLSDSGVDYWSPQVGAPVAFTTQTKLPNGAVNAISATLVKTNKVASLLPVDADNLNAPRGLTYDPLGNLWVTQGGTGGAGPCVPFMGNTNCFGNSGSVSVVAKGNAYDIVSNLASLDTPVGDEVSGANGITFAGFRPYVVFGNAGPQSATSGLGAAENQLGIVGTVNIGPSGLVPEIVTSLANYEYTVNPDNRPNPDGTITPESNPYGITSIGDDVYVADGAAHTVVKVTPNGQITLVGVMPAQDVPVAGSATPTHEDSVPTGIIPAPDGNGLLSADYSGYPYLPGSARIWRFNIGQDPTLYATGLTNVVGISPDQNGGVYALETSADGQTAPALQISGNSVTSGGSGGAVIHIDRSGAQTTLACAGLVYPTGIATAPDGSLRISNYGLIPGQGQVVTVKTN